MKSIVRAKFPELKQPEGRNQSTKAMHKSFALLWPFHNNEQLNNLIEAKDYQILVEHFQIIESSERKRGLEGHPFYDANYHLAVQEFIKILKCAQKTPQKQSL